MATLGVKTLLNFTRDHSVDDALKFGLTWNAAMLQTDDVMRAGQAFFTKTAPSFDDLVPLRGAKRKLVIRTSSFDKNEARSQSQSQSQSQRSKL